MLTRSQLYVPVTLILLGTVAFAAFGVDEDLGPTSGGMPLLAAAVAVNLIAVPLWALRTQLVLRHLGHHAGLASLLLLTTFANVGNQLLPAAGGEIARGTYLSKLHDVPVATTAGALVFERLFGFLLMTATAFGAIVAVRFGLELGIVAGIGAVLVSAGALTAIGRSRYGFKPSPEEPTGIRRRFLAVLASMSGEIRALAAHPSLLLMFTALSVTIYIVLTVGFVLSAAAMGVSLNAVEAWALHGSGMTVGTLSAIPFGLGAAEAAIATIGAWTGLSVMGMLAAAIGMRMALTLPLGVLGAASYVALSKRLGAKLAEPLEALAVAGVE